MIQPEGKRFLYQAQAVAAAGTFESPYQEQLPSQASCGLAMTGGLASSKVENFAYRNILSFSLGESHLLGQPGTEEGVYASLATSTLEGFNAMNMVTADRIAARLSWKAFADRSETSFLAVGSHIENLRVAGQPVEMELDGQILSDWDTYQKARLGYEKRDGVIIPDGQLIGRSIVLSVSQPAGTKATGNRIDIPEFGSVFLGEIYLTPASRRVVMIRIKFGCAVRGDGEGGDVGGNGLPYPP